MQPAIKPENNLFLPLPRLPIGNSYVLFTSATGTRNLSELLLALDEQGIYEKGVRVFQQAGVIF
jgi:hypothetical protein